MKSSVSFYRTSKWVGFSAGDSRLRAKVKITEDKNEKSKPSWFLNFSAQLLKREISVTVWTMQTLIVKAKDD